MNHVIIGTVLTSLVVPFASMAKERPAPVVVVVGETIGPFRLGMTLAEAKKASRRPLTPEGIDRAGQTGWKTGPILLLIDDASGKVANVSLELAKSPGVRIGKVKIPRNAKLDAIHEKMPECTLEPGSGGRSLTCMTEAGGTLHVYDSYMGKDVWVMLP